MSNWEEEREERHRKIDEALAKHKLTIESTFVPWSQSRNKSKDLCLNWMVTLKQDGRVILTADYSAGMGHTPWYKGIGAGVLKMSLYNHERIKEECEKGFAVSQNGGENFILLNKKQPILPDTRDVIHSLLMDADVLDFATYEEWAPEMGYDADSRMGERIYQECMKLALQLRKLGDATIEELHRAFEGY